MVCSCLPIVRGLFAPQTLGRVKQGSQTRGYVSETNANSSLYLDEYNLRNPDYIKMADAVGYAVNPDQETGTVSRKQQPQEPKKILVRTDIKVTNADDVSE